MTMTRHTEIEAQLRDALAGWERKLAAIQADRRRQSAPLDRNLDDQAIQRENDAALDALDEQGQREFKAIAAALERIASGVYGQCLDCGGTISVDRLKALPSASRCVECAQSESAA